MAKQRAKAHIRFNELGEPKVQAASPSSDAKKVEAEDVATPEGDSSLLAVYDGGEDTEGVSLISGNTSGVGTPAESEHGEASENNKAKRKRSKKGKNTSGGSKEKKRK